jgi:hypothetical protein
LRGIRKKMERKDTCCVQAQRMSNVAFFRNYRMKDGIYKSNVAEYDGGGRLKEII